MTRGGGGLDISVYPSGSARNTASAPMLPAAPGRLSTITGWPHFSDSFSATMRGMRSALPPAGNGTTIRTAFAGHSCAWTAVARNVASATAARNLMRSTEPPQHSDAHHVVDIHAVERNVAADLFVALPVETNAEVTKEIPFQAGPIGDVAVAYRFHAARRSIERSVIGADAQVRAQMLVDRQDAERGDIPYGAMDGLGGSRTGRLQLAEVLVGRFRREIAHEPVPREHAVREVLVIARAPTAGENAKAT